jgi:hypothetical protein
MQGSHPLQAAELEKKEYDLTPLKESKLPIIWVLGKYHSRCNTVPNHKRSLLYLLPCKQSTQIHTQKISHHVFNVKLYCFWNLFLNTALVRHIPP